MNTDEQRIAISEACGWRRKEVRYKDGSLASQGWVAPDGVGRPLPDYLHDLNAMHEAEETLPPRHEQYAIELARVIECNKEEELNNWDIWKVAHATADKRAEAFLRCSGRWLDD